MKLSDEKRIDAPRDAVWAGLNDPEILKQSIPGCDTLTQLSDTEFEAEVTGDLVGECRVGAARVQGQLLRGDLLQWLH